MKRRELKSAILKHIVDSKHAHATLAQAFLYTGVPADAAKTETARICAIIGRFYDELHLACLAADIQFSDMFGRDGEPQHIFITVFRMDRFGYGRLLGGADSQGEVYLYPLDFQGNRAGTPGTIAV